MNAIVKAIKFRKDGFYTQPFAFGGEEGMDKFNPAVRYAVTQEQRKAFYLEAVQRQSE